jgi:hypothetical protein
MQAILWLVLFAAAGGCVAGLAMIGLDGRRKLKARRRTEHVRKWVQSETAPSIRARSASAS